MTTYEFSSVAMSCLGMLFSFWTMRRIYTDQRLDDIKKEMDQIKHMINEGPIHLRDGANGNLGVVVNVIPKRAEAKEMEPSKRSLAAKEMWKRRKQKQLENKE